jgi:hypothetical protein
MRTNELNKTTALATDQKVVQGIGKHFVKVKTVTFAGVSYTPAALKALFQDEIDANNALDGIRAQMKEQVIAIRAIRSKAGAARKGLGAYILATYGANAAQVLEDFGISPPKTPGAKTAEVKAAAAAKAVATRKARRDALKAVAGVSSSPTQASVPAPAVQAPQPAQVAAPAAASTSH